MIFYVYIASNTSKMNQDSIIAMYQSQIDHCNAVLNDDDLRLSFDGAKDSLDFCLERLREEKALKAAALEPS